MNSTIRTLTTCLLTLALAGACQKHDPHHGHDHGPGGHSHGDETQQTEGGGEGHDDHGDRVDLGEVTVVGRHFSVARFGNVEPGKEAGFEVSVDGDAAGLSPFLWVEDAGGEQVGGPESGSLENGKWHFHVTPRADGGMPMRVVLRLRHDGKDERAGLPLSGHGHEHQDTPHDGVLAALKDASGKQVGHIELKLHDDKGDLELWIAKDDGITQPLDLSLDVKPTVTFVDHDGRKVELAVRNTDKNEDEDGNPNIRGGKTNYFIFPGDTGADASWLKGKEFRSIVSVSIPAEGGALTSAEFVLKPHTH